MVFIGRLKTDIKRTLVKFVWPLAIIFAISAFIFNVVFAVSGLNVPVEIVWNDNGVGTRPAQVILHLRKVGTQTDISTATLTSANADPSDSNKWKYTFTNITYDSNATYEVYQDTATEYTNSGTSTLTITNAPSVSSFTALDSSLLNSGTRYVGDIDFALNKYNGNYYLFTRTGSAYSGTDLSNLVAELSELVGENITITNYVHKANGTQQGGNARISYTGLSSNNVGLRILATQQAVYYGTLSSQTSTKATITNTYQGNNHSVSYQFDGNILPPNYSSLLPASANYAAGATVTVAQNPTATGYRFLGWTINGSPAGNSFTMPANDVTITGSWEYFNGYFAPTISKQITNPQNIYRYGDTVEFLVTVSNSESYPITNVEVTENLAGARFLAASGYTVSNNGSIATIASIPANGTAVLYAEYDITDDVTQTGRTNTVEITAASASNYYYLDTSQSITASATFDTQSWQDVPVLTGVDISPRTTLLYYFLLVIGAGGIVGGVVVNQKIKEREK